jgi:iron complex transport system substrate-binding protein
MDAGLDRTKKDLHLMLGMPTIAPMASSRRYQGRTAGWLGFAAVAMALAACGSAVSSSSPIDPPNSQPETTTPTSAAAAVVPSAPPSTSVATSISDVADEPQRIMPLDGDLAEVVFALGQGGDVVATDISATYPPEADALPDIGYQRALAAEPIAAFEPTLALATDIAGPPEVLDELERLGIDVVMIPTESSPQGPGNKIRAVAAALDISDAGERLAADVDAAIDAAIARARAAPNAPRIGVLYLRGENVQLLFGTGTDTHWMIEAVGGIDIADELGVDDTAPINAEALVVAAPEVLIVPERGLESVGGIDGLLALPGIAATPAGEQRRVLVYDDQLLLGNGPRTAELLEQLITDLYEGAI